MPEPTLPNRPHIFNLADVLFQKNGFDVPDYQRPYKWSEKNVHQLLDDLLLFSTKSAYRLGTIVLHRDGDGLHIVDGQQRLFTLSLIAAELLKTSSGTKLFPDYKSADLALAGIMIKNPITLQNLTRNHRAVCTRVREFGEAEIHFFFKQCELVYIELADISEAFQFFDSQNTRGRDLDPHDLLKAFHLRAMSEESEQVKLDCVARWEAASGRLSNLFADYLFKIRRWSKGKNGLGFTKKDIGIFKGIGMAADRDEFPFAASFRITHFFVDQYRQDFTRKIDGQQLNYPFQLDQVMINGRRFFDFTAHYADLIRQLEIPVENTLLKSWSRVMGINDADALEILGMLDEYAGRHRRGDRYLRSLFDCTLLYYFDRFGSYKIDAAVIKIFLWTYALRLQKIAVQEAAVDQLGRQGDGLIRQIREAIHPADFINSQPQPVKLMSGRAPVAHLDRLITMFQKFNMLN